MSIYFQILKYLFKLWKYISDLVGDANDFKGITFLRGILLIGG
jgi:hypothetical protein